jgi:hypothetical protein
MVGIARLIFGILLLALSGASWGYACTKYKVNSPFSGGFVFVNSKQAACQVQLEAQEANKPQCAAHQPYSGTIVATQDYCHISAGCGPGQSQYYWSYSSQAGECGCTAPLIERDGRCVDPCEHLEGSQISERVIKSATISFGKATVCDEGASGACKAEAEVTACGGEGAARYCWTSPGKFTGTSCTVGDSLPKTAEKSIPSGSVTNTLPYPKGKCPGTVNGVEVLVDCGTFDESSPKTTVTGPSVTETTATAAPGTPDKTSTSTVTECKDGICKVVTRTVTTKDGVDKTATSTQTKDEGSLCKDNPTLTVCKNGVFGGTCVAGFSCDGDAVHCAVAKAVNDTKCLLSGSAAVDSEVAKMVAGTWSGTLGTSTKAVGQFNQTNPFSSACPGNQTVTVGATVISIPLASVCTELQMMGNILVAFTLLGATIFVLKGFGSS